MSNKNQKEARGETVSKKIVVGIAGAGAVAGVILLARQGKAAAKQRFPESVKQTLEPKPKPKPKPKTKTKTRPKTKQAQSGIGAGVQISPHFNTSEFLRAANAPGLQKWKIPPEHYANLKRLVLLVLEPSRLAHGPIIIRGGYRPLNFKFQDGRTWAQKLKDEGMDLTREYSDHYHAGAADTIPKNRKNIIPYWMGLLINPHVRQAIMYITTKDKNGKPLKSPQVYNIHVSVITDEFPKLTRHHYILKDGKVVKEITT